MAIKSVGVIGAGTMGNGIAHVFSKGGFDVVMVDVVEGLPQGKALDLMEAGPIVGYDSKITGSNGYAETANSDVVVITSGIARTASPNRRCVASSWRWSVTAT